MGELIVCMVNETCMVSEAEGWLQGHREWRIVHDCEQGLDHAHGEGNLPPAFAEIRAELIARQQAEGGDKAGVDHVFDVPVEVAKSFTDYRYDSDPPGLPPGAFEVCEFTRPLAEKKSFFQRLFGK